MKVRTCLYLLMTAAPTALVTANAQGQTITPPPAFPNVDANGIDLTTGGVTFTIPVGSIGDVEGGVALSQIYSTERGARDAWSGALYQETVDGISRTRVEFGGMSDIFSNAAGAPAKQDGSSLVTTTEGYRYTGRDGTVIDYRSRSDSGYLLRGPECTINGSATCSIPVAITKPNGMRFALTWDILEMSHNCGYEQQQVRSSTLTMSPVPAQAASAGTQQIAPAPTPSAAGACTRSGYFRLLNISSSARYGVSIGYDPAAGIILAPSTSWYRRTSANFYNSQKPCGNECPAATYRYPVQGQTTITDRLNRQWQFGSTSNGASIKRPGSSGTSTTYTFNNASSRSVTNEIGTWNYSWSDSGSRRTMTVSGPVGYTRQVVSDLTVGRPISDIDANKYTTSYQYDSAGRLTRVTLPEGNYTQYSYDGRGNVTQTQTVAKQGGASIVTTAGYPTNCDNPKICNQPVWTRDARGSQTDYEYEGVLGGFKTISMPAGETGIRPQQRFFYADLPGAGGETVWKLALVAACQTLQSCTGSSDEARRQTIFDRSGVNNMLPVATRNDAGNGSTASQTNMGYDAAGNVVQIDGPLPGTQDFTRNYYDAARQQIGSIGSDPDGGRPRRPMAVRYSYNADGQRTTVERGVANDQSDGALGGMQVLASVRYDIDGAGRVISEGFYGTGAVYAATQYSYDAAGRIDCVTQRMNPASYSAMPHGCSQAAIGNYGQDRITKNHYDPGGRLIAVDIGVGTNFARTDLRKTYTANGNVSSVIDAKNNITSYNYDGFDRLESLFYPDKNNGANPSGSDYETYSYDKSSNLVSRRVRDGQVLNYRYDALNQMVIADNPGTNIAEVDQSFDYDNLGRLKVARDANGWYSAFNYDALGRVVGQSSNVSSNTMQYDEAGRRVRQTWSDGFSIGYAYFGDGNLGHVQENNGQVILSMDYDDLGRRTVLARGNNTATYYAYDDASNLAAMTHDLAGTVADVSMAWRYNPAGQITSRETSNDLYAYTGAYDVNRGYSANSLNQYTASGQVAPSYDGRGNLTQAGGQTYQYNTRNQLFADGSNNLFYRNPMGLLNHIVARGPGTTNDLDYVGTQLAGEYNGSLLRRYVFDPTGGDTPLVQYEGSGTNARTWLYADERGSIIAVGDQSGNPAAINSYDEYGIPAATNVGRFQYTGQMWIPELGMYDYKARVYSPTLGRFLQADPIGYGDGMNMYGYVGGDPVNGVDPMGLCTAGPVYNNCNGSPEDVTVIGKNNRNNGSGSSINITGLFNPAYKFVKCAIFGCKKKKEASPDAPQNPKPRVCYGPPQGPKGSSAGELAAQAKQNGDQAAQHSATDLSWFKSQVQNSGPWDYKQYDRGFQDYGNYNYGYTGARQGIPGPVLRAGAGYAQVRAGTSSLSFITSAFDDPRDQEQINRGISDAQNRCY